MGVLQSEHEMWWMRRYWKQIIHVDGVSPLLGILLVMARLHQMAKRCQYVPYGLFWELGKMMKNRN